jgi:hypothetical protein
MGPRGAWRGAVLVLQGSLGSERGGCGARAVKLPPARGAGLRPLIAQLLLQTSGCLAGCSLQLQHRPGHAGPLAGGWWLELRPTRPNPAPLLQPGVSGPCPAAAGLLGATHPRPSCRTGTEVPGPTTASSACEEQEISRRHEGKSSVET